jgi:hypothetical protein
MTIRTVTVYLRAEVATFLKGMKESERGTKSLKDEIDKLEKSAHSLTKAGLISSLAGLPGVLAPAGAAVAALPGLVLTAGASFGALALAVHGTGDAIRALHEGDAGKLREALAGLSVEARRFVGEYEHVKAAMSGVGDRNQDAFFRQFRGDLQRLAEVYLPTMLNQLPRVSAELGQAGHEFAAWAGQPLVVAKINRQMESAAELTGEWTRLLRAATSMMLDLADSSRGFNKGFVGGLADGTEALEKWVAKARATGQLTKIFENAQRVLSGLAKIAAQLGEILFDVMANPALTDGAMTLLNVLGMTLDVVQALLTVFESLPPGMQSTVVTFAVLGGAVMLVTGRIIALKAAIESMKLSATGTASAVKGVGAFLAGPWGIAIAAAVALTTAFAAAQADAEAAADGLRATLDKQTGAITRSTRVQVIENLAKSGALKLAKDLGLNLEELTTAVLGGSEATRAYYERQVQLAGGYSKVDAKYSSLITKLGEGAAAVDMAQAGFVDMGAAMGEAGKDIDATTGKVKNQITALQKLADQLQAQTDPVFALIKAQKDLRDSQVDYSEAVEKYGRKSQEAKDASIALAEASVRLTGAVAATAGTFNGQLTPELYAALSAAGLTERQIKDVEQSFKTAAAAGNAFAGTYEVRIQASQLDAAIAKAQRLRALLGSFAAAANVNGDYVSGRRWGGITEHARDGLLREAKVYTAVSSGARYAFAEPATKGEAFIPRNGDRDRSLGIIGTAAGWYGHTLAPAGGMGGGGGGGVQTIVHKHEHTVTIQGRELMTGFRREIYLSGGIVQNAAGSRPV